MKLKFVLFLVAVVMGVSAVWAQGKVTGKVIDAKSGQAVEYAAVMMLKTTDSSLVTGVTTGVDGSFEMAKVPYGKYLVKVSFMGYKNYFHPQQVILSSSKPAVALGKMAIAPTATMLEAAEVVAERSMVEYQLDKRVINVDKNIVASGGTATDILENVPSVAIDNDGNVTLRGSSNVKILVDGRPYELLSSDLESLLEQIPASSVENVEVITNPSAKYDPEGMSGIINLKMKDKSVGAKGLNGVVNLNAGTPLPMMIPDGMPRVIPTVMGSVNLNYSTEKFNVFFSADGGRRSRANYSNSYVERRREGITHSIDSLYQQRLNGNYMGSVKIGAEYNINKKNSLLLSYQRRGGNRKRQSMVNSIDLLPQHLHLLDYTQTDTNSLRNGNQVLNLLYTKKFDEPEHQLTVDVTYNHRNGGGNGRQEQVYDSAMANAANYYLLESYSNRYNDIVNMKLDYSRPFWEAMKFEAGYEGRVQQNDQRYEYYRTTTTTARALDSNSTTHYRYGQQIHALYATVGGKFGKGLSAQAGLRGEMSTVNGVDVLHSDVENISKAYYKLYPTLHLSYDISKTQSLQVSYSRRVRRPHMWDLNPYLDVRQGMEMGFGNPGLAPEFTNAFEASYNVSVDKLNIFTSLYYRQTDSMMTRYGFVWSDSSAAYYSPWMLYNPEYDGYWASTWQNLNKGRNFGAELIVDYQITKWWKANVSVNLYQNYIEGTELLDNTDRRAFRASGKLSTFMTLPQMWTVQLSAQYRAPFMDLQTDMNASYWCDLAVKKDVLQRRGTVNIRISDLFCTGGFGHTTDNDQLYRVMKSRRISPAVTVGFSYKINNGLKIQRKPNEMNDSDDGGADGAF